MPDPRRSFLVWTALLATISGSARPQGAPIDPPAAGLPDKPLIAFEPLPDGLRITIDDRPLARYRFEQGETTRPSLEHLRAPGGSQVSRTNPPVEGADLADHPTMHPGLWMAFGDLSGADSWRNREPIRHARFVEGPVGGPGRGRFTATNLHEKAGRVIAEETFRLSVRIRPVGTLLIWDSEFEAVGDALVFGDQEEMGLGLRLASPIAVVNGGRIVDSEGRVDEAQVWGTQGSWCSYSGEVEGDRAGVLVVPDPENVHRSWYHARDYGLIVANPFGRNAFTGGDPSRLVVEPGQSLRLRYGVLLFDGEIDPAEAARDVLDQLEREEN